MGRQSVRFYMIDVFAREPLSGNPLSLVVDAQDLSQETMQRIAREFNQSETTFLLPATRPHVDWRLRSFTPMGVEVGGEPSFANRLRPARRGRHLRTSQMEVESDGHALDSISPRRSGS